MHAISVDAENEQDVSMDAHEHDFRLQHVARTEGKTIEEVGSEAVDFYARLSPAARRALRALAVLGGDQGMDAAARAAGRGIVQVGVDIVRQRGRLLAARAYTNGQLQSEEDVEREAVRLSREASAASQPGR